jgi:hypothetical protein
MIVKIQYFSDKRKKPIEEYMVVDEVIPIEYCPFCGTNIEME